MTSKTDIPPSKRLLRTLNGEAVWPPPMWLMRQAGRFLPEFRAMRARADFLTRCMTPDIATELTLQPIRRFGMDGAILFSDILILPWAMGQSLEFVEGTGPVLGAIRSEADLAKLDPERIAEVTAPVLETLSRLKGILNGPDDIGVAKGGATTLLGFTGSPFTVACYMVEGGGSREFAITRTMAFSEPALFDRLMALLTEQTATYLCAQIEAGAEAVMLFDSWAGLLSPAEFRKHVIAPTRQIVQTIKARYPSVRVIGFPRLGGVMVAEYARETGVDVLALDTGADFATVRSMVPEHVALQGNLDPVAVLAGGEAMRREALAVRNAGRGRAHVFNLGHGVLPQTPVEHVADLVKTVRETEL
ncbi:uroporphyrinogen decarboxylase [Acetobacter cerevisiae]|uniref:uroporphyrinogen decarboxylase n=1 Tax=Acetobacter cerevisiae TaxID=178900 RepID=UPI00209FAB6C|nr:uroporphyrinogen decarboxylase [Acetobacter cerevisiae]MCP1269478.1 uroporphyrinogen decarboxylase [Acetobacter cerevisiae]MCP1277432.1 uroporphyrinogen decarboxylase [Acetobacter cerevisiae]